MRYAFGGVLKDVAVAILSFLSPWGLMPRYACPLLADRPRAFRADARTGPPRRHGPRPVRGWHDDHHVDPDVQHDRPTASARHRHLVSGQAGHRDSGGRRVSRCCRAPPALADRALLARIVRNPGAIALPYGHPREPGIRGRRTAPSRKRVHGFPACMDPAELVDSYLNRLDDMRLRARSDPRGGRPRGVTLSPEARPQ